MLTNIKSLKNVIENQTLVLIKVSKIDKLTQCSHRPCLPSFSISLGPPPLCLHLFTLELERKDKQNINQHKKKKKEIHKEKRLDDEKTT